MALLKRKYSPGCFLTLSVLSVLSVLTTILTLAGCSTARKSPIGFPGGPLLPSVYIAQKEPAITKSFSFSRFDQQSDIAIALAAGKLDAGFVDPATVKYLKEKNLLDGLSVLGKVEFTYGATAVLSDKYGGDFDSSIKGLRVAIDSPDCVLGQSFLAESERRGIDPKAYKIEYIPFSDMVTALEADKVDIIVARPAYAAIASGLGHRVIYRNYDVPADSCCPATLNQLALILLVRTSATETVAPLVRALLNEEETKARKDLRKAVHDETGIAPEVLEQFPLAVFSGADDKLLHLIQKQITEEENESNEKN